MTDEPEVAQLAHGQRFSQVVMLDPAAEGLGAVGGGVPLAETAAQTHLAGCFARLIDWLDAVRGPFLLWCHLKGLGGPWDAPLELRRAYADEDDPPPPESAAVPDRLLAPDHDPDELLGITQSYSGQISLLDMCLGALCQHLRKGPLGADTLLVVASARGFPLGEHLRVGPCDHALYGELTWAPLLVRLPGAVAAAGAARSQAMVEPADLWATLLEWHGVVDPTGSPTGRSLLPLVRGQSDALRDRLAVAGLEGERALVTPAWSLRLGKTVELFARPDDLWQVNNVANRCPEVVQAMAEVLSQYEQTLHSSQDPYTVALQVILREGME
jgi:arylsulfatase A-like enzyme